jgi:hypothetical protein
MGIRGERPHGCLPPQGKKIFMSPGTAGTRLFERGHQYSQSKGFCYLSKMEDWCHVGNKGVLELATRGRHFFSVDLGEFNADSIIFWFSY